MPVSEAITAASAKRWERDTVLFADLPLRMMQLFSPCSILRWELVMKSYVSKSASSILSDVNLW